MFGHWADTFNWACGQGALFSGPLGVLMNIIFWGLLLYLVYTVLRVLSDLVFGSRKKDYADSPSAVLKMRFARGEIDADQYERMKHAMEQ